MEAFGVSRTVLREALRTLSVKAAVETVSATVRAPRKAIYARALELVLGEG